jgi:hypothetical protein
MCIHPRNINVLLKKEGPNRGNAAENERKSCSGFTVYLIPSHFFLQFLWEIIALSTTISWWNFPSLSHQTIDFHLCALLSNFRRHTQNSVHRTFQSIVISFRVKSNLIVQNHEMDVLIDVLTFLRIQWISWRREKKVYRQKMIIIILSTQNEEKEFFAFQKFSDINSLRLVKATFKECSEMRIQ